MEQIKTKLLWDKIPSVTNGGANYFYNTFTNDPILGGKKVTVIFNRQSKLWDIETDYRYEIDKGYIYDIIKSGFKSAKLAMKYYETL